MSLYITKDSKLDFYPDWVREKLQNKIWIGRGLGFTDTHQKITQMKLTVLRSTITAIDKADFKCDTLKRLFFKFAKLMRAEVKKREYQLKKAKASSRNQLYRLNDEYRAGIKASKAAPARAITACPVCKCEIYKQVASKAFCSQSCRYEALKVSRKTETMKKNEKK